MRRAGVVLASIALAATIAGCVSVGHTWQDEFTARLEGAGASVEEALTEVGSGTSKAEDFQGYANLGRELGHEGELLEGLDPPRGCTEVQVKGFDHIKSSGHFASEVRAPDYPERLLKADRVSLENELRVLARLEREAQSCARS
jgi:hypothetical protein